MLTVLKLWLISVGPHRLLTFPHFRREPHYGYHIHAQYVWLDKSTAFGFGSFYNFINNIKNNCKIQLMTVISSAFIMTRIIAIIHARKFKKNNFLQNFFLLSNMVES